MSLERFERAFVASNRAVIFAMMAVMATLVFVNVIARYVFTYSIIWTEEVSQYLMVWIAYLGAGLALREGRHVALEMLQDRLPAGGRWLLRAALGGTILLFLAALTVLGFQFAAFAWVQETPVLNISLGIPYLAVPLGALLCGLHLVLVFRDYTEKRFAPAFPLDEHLDEGGA